MHSLCLCVNYILCVIGTKLKAFFCCLKSALTAAKTTALASLPTNGLKGAITTKSV